jgi:ParB family chromosome partitioning protein
LSDSPRAEPFGASSQPATTARASTDERAIAIAKLVQSLRRNELSPVGEARLFLKLMTEHMASIGDITVATGRTKEQVARSLRLLSLSDRLRDLIDRGALSREQAFALLDVEEPASAVSMTATNSGYRTP